MGPLPLKEFLRKQSWNYRNVFFEELLNTTATIQGNRLPTRKYLSWALAFALALKTVWAVMTLVHPGAGWMNFVQDDFFYYLKVAANVASGKGSTFNGLVSTNGYHPLWMLTLAAVVRLGGGVRFIPAFLAISIALATISTFALSFLLLRRTGADVLAVTSISIYVAVYSLHIFNCGMEVTLAVPLLLGLFVLLEQDIKPWTGLAVGFLSSLIVLSRLDLILFAALLAAAVVLQPDLRLRFRAQYLGLSLGLSPLAVYFLTNTVFFGIWMPISGMAKQLKLDHGFTSPAWESLWHKSTVQLLNLAPILLALALLPWIWKRLPPPERAFLPAALSFPFLYIGLLSWRSDWPLWPWYFYMLPPAVLAAFLVFFRTGQCKRMAAWSPFTLLLLVFATCRVQSENLVEQQTYIVEAAWKVEQFSLSHPGIYAMGDRSGMVGFLLHQPVIQTEGLMMDGEYLRLIAKQRPLRSVLDRYGVRYYIATATEPFNGCFPAVEPAQAGPHAPHLRGEFCGKPAAEWTIAGGRTMIFDLQSRQNDN